MTNQYKANVNVLVWAAECNRRGDTPSRDQALRQTLTPKQIRQFVFDIGAGVSAEQAARKALAVSAY